MNSSINQLVNTYHNPTYHQLGLQILKIFNIYQIYHAFLSIHISNHIQ